MSENKKWFDKFKGGLSTLKSRLSEKASRDIAAALLSSLGVTNENVARHQELKQIVEQAQKQKARPKGPVITNPSPGTKTLDERRKEKRQRSFDKQIDMASTYEFGKEKEREKRKSQSTPNRTRKISESSELAKPRKRVNKLKSTKPDSNTLSTPKKRVNKLKSTKPDLNALNKNEIKKDNRASVNKLKQYQNSQPIQKPKPITPPPPTFKPKKRNR